MPPGPSASVLATGRDVAPAPAPRARSRRLDALRGGAVVAMVVYHAAWDMTLLRLVATDVTASPGWSLFARAIAASFLLLAGAGLAFAHRGGIDRPRFLRRLGVVALAAAAVTATTLATFPDSFIFFGVLHNIALSSVLALPFTRAPAWAAAAAGLACLAAAGAGAGTVLDAPALAFLGLGGHVPTTNDFVPVAPWTGFVLIGVALGKAAPRLLAGPPDGRPRGRIGRALAWAGRRSLLVYLVHQPALLGLLSLAALALPPNEAAEAAPFLRRCAASCREAGQPEAVCAASCACTVERLRASGRWRTVVDGRPDAAAVAGLSAIAQACYAEAAGGRSTPR